MGKPIDDHFLQRYRLLLDTEDAAFDALEHATEDGDAVAFEAALVAWLEALDAKVAWLDLWLRPFSARPTRRGLSRPRRCPPARPTGSDRSRCLRMQAAAADQAELADSVALLDQLVQRDLDACLGEVVVLDTLGHLPGTAAIGDHRVAEHQALGHAVLALELTATETQSPAAVASRIPTTVSMAALAAEAAEEAPHASMIAAPRFCTVSMKGPSSQAWSPMT
jgi:hypothetical protein